MSNYIVQHIPGFVETEKEPERVDFDTLEELLAIPFVASWKADPPFERFSLSMNHLMAEMKDGSYWVVGYLQHPELVQLPQWRGP